MRRAREEKCMAPSQGNTSRCGLRPQASLACTWGSTQTHTSVQAVSQHRPPKLPTQTVAQHLLQQLQQVHAARGCQPCMPAQCGIAPAQHALRPQVDWHTGALRVLAYTRRGPVCARSRCPLASSGLRAACSGQARVRPNSCTWRSGRVHVHSHGAQRLSLAAWSSSSSSAPWSPLWPWPSSPSSASFTSTRPLGGEEGGC